MSEPTASEPRPSEGALLDDPATADLAAKVTESWNDFSSALGKALGELAPGAALDVTVDQMALEGGTPMYEVSALCPEAGQLTAFAVGNSMLPEQYRLSRDAVGQLVALGWAPPGAGATKDERYSIQSPQAQSARLAAVLTRTLRDVYGAPHPAFLVYTVDPNRTPNDAAAEAGQPSLGAARPVA